MYSEKPRKKPTLNKDASRVHTIYACMGNKELRELGNYFVYLLALFHSLIDIDVI